MDKTTTLMFRIACGMVITVCGMVISVPVIKGVLWVRGEVLLKYCWARGDTKSPMGRLRTGIGCSHHRYDPDFF